MAAALMSSGAANSPTKSVGLQQTERDLGDEEQKQGSKSKAAKARR